MPTYVYRVANPPKVYLGGSIIAESMEDAVHKVKRRHNLELKFDEPRVRPCDGEIIHQAKWFWEGKHVFLSITPPPELFKRNPQEELSHEIRRHE